MPRPVLRLLTVVVAAGAAAVAVRLPDVASWRALDLAVVALLAAATFAGEQLNVNVRFGEQTKHVTVTEAASNRAGLGVIARNLAVTRKIIETHHGKLEILPPKADGAGLVRISLPLGPGE